MPSPNYKSWSDYKGNVTGMKSWFNTNAYKSWDSLYDGFLKSTYKQTTANIAARQKDLSNTPNNDKTDIAKKLINEFMYPQIILDFHNQEKTNQDTRHTEEDPFNMSVDNSFDISESIRNHTLTIKKQIIEALGKEDGERHFYLAMLKIQNEGNIINDLIDEEIRNNLERFKIEEEKRRAISNFEKQEKEARNVIDTEMTDSLDALAKKHDELKAKSENMASPSQRKTQTPSSDSSGYYTRASQSPTSTSSSPLMYAATPAKSKRTWGDIFSYIGWSMATFFTLGLNSTVRNKRREAKRKVFPKDKLKPSTNVVSKDNDSMTDAINLLPESNTPIQVDLEISEKLTGKLEDWQYAKSEYNIGSDKLQLSPNSEQSESSSQFITDSPRSEQSGSYTTFPIGSFASSKDSDIATTPTQDTKVTSKVHVDDVEKKIAEILIKRGFPNDDGKYQAHLIALSAKRQLQAANPDGEVTIIEEGGKIRLEIPMPNPRHITLLHTVKETNDGRLLAPMEEVLTPNKEGNFTFDIKIESTTKELNNPNLKDKSADIKSICQFEFPDGCRVKKTFDLKTAESFICAMEEIKSKLSWGKRTMSPDYRKAIQKNIKISPVEEEVKTEHFFEADEELQSVQPNNSLKFNNSYLDSKYNGSQENLLTTQKSRHYANIESNYDSLCGVASKFMNVHAPKTIIEGSNLSKDKKGESVLTRILMSTDPKQLGDWGIKDGKEAYALPKDLKHAPLIEKATNTEIQFCRIAADQVKLKLEEPIGPKPKRYTS